MASQTTKAPVRMSTKAKTVDEYLAAAPTDQRAALRRLRGTIKFTAERPLSDGRVTSIVKTRIAAIEKAD